MGLVGRHETIYGRRNANQRFSLICSSRTEKAMYSTQGKSPSSFAIADHILPPFVRFTFQLSVFNHSNLLNNSNIKL